LANGTKVRIGRLAGKHITEDTMKTLTEVQAIVALTALVAACDTHSGPTTPGLLPLNAELSDYSDWTAPVNLGSVINTAGDENRPAISKDGLSLIVSTSRPGGFGGLDLWVSQRASVDDPWGPLQNLGPAINSDSAESAPTFSPDGHRLYFHSAKTGGCGAIDLYVARRHDKRDDLDWQPAENLGCVVNSIYDDAGPTIFEDGGVTTLLFTSTRPGGPGGFDIYQTTRVGDDGEFGPPALVPELSGPFRDTRTTISRDHLELIMSSDATGRPGGIGGQDLWVSTRATTSDLWSTPVNLGPTVNTTAFDGAAALSFDGTTLYFFSNRPGGSGGNDIWVTTRTKLRGNDVALSAKGR
jgi:Tol biopolymer transport system component